MSDATALENGLEESPLYAPVALENALGIRFVEPSREQIDGTQETLVRIAHRLGAEAPDCSTFLPTKGFVAESLDPEDYNKDKKKEAARRTRNVIEAILGPLYAWQNASEQKDLRNAPIAEEGEPMVNVREFLDSRSLRCTFSGKGFDAACGEYAGSERIFWMRRGAADRLIAITEALNHQDIMPHIEDCFRYECIQWGLLLRRVMLVTINHPDKTAEDIECIAKSLTASSPCIAGHQMGGAIDLRLRRMRSGKPGDFLKLGNAYPEGGAHVAERYPYVTYDQWSTRVIAASTARMGRMKTLSTEDWHWCYGDPGMGVDPRAAALPAFYGPIRDFNRANGAIVPYGDADLRQDYLTPEECSAIVAMTQLLVEGQNPASVGVLETIRRIVPDVRDAVRDVTKERLAVYAK